MRWVALSFFALAAVVGAAFAFAGAGEGEAHSLQVPARHFHARATTFVQIDNGRKGSSAGDISTFTHALTERGGPVGRDQGYCVRILRGTSECTMTTVLRDGRIMVAGSFDDVGVNRLAVTGGTGAYTHASGSVSVRRAGFFQLDLTYSLSLG